MNKYEKAYKELVNDFCQHNGFDLMYELVERATLKKRAHTYPYECPNDCGAFALSKADNFCPNCGQALESSE